MEDNKIFCIDGAKRERDVDISSTTSSISSSHSDSIITYKTRWVVLAIFSLISMANAVIWISLSSITSIVKEYYGVSYPVVNWLAMIFSVMYIFVLLSAYCLNKYGLKFTILVGAVANALASCLRLIGSGRDGFIFVLMGNGLAGLAQSFILFVPPTLAATWFGESERGTASAIGMLMNMLGVAIGYLMGGTLVPSSDDYDGIVKDGLFKSLFAQAVFCTILVIISVIFVRRVPLTPPSMSQALKLRQNQKKKLKKKIQKEKEVKLTGYINYASDSIQNSDDFYECSSNNSSSTLEDDSFQTYGFIDSFRQLAKNKPFHLITHSYGLYFGLYLAINTLLNHICTMNFPGKEQEIGIMGFISVILGLIAILIAGIWIDKTRQYKLIAIMTFLFCGLTLLTFILVLNYSNNFKASFVCFCIFGFFSYPYMTIGLEHAAEVAYPISEGITSGILLLVANMYGIAFTYLLEYIIDEFGTGVAGYIIVGLYFTGQILCFFTNGELKRYQADRQSMNSSNSSSSIGHHENESYLQQIV